MTQVLSYFSPDAEPKLAGDPGELARMQQQLNAGALLMYVARRRAANTGEMPTLPVVTTRVLSGPASFTPPLPRQITLQGPPVSPWC